jgi:hypothetical protein
MSDDCYPLTVALDQSPILQNATLPLTSNSLGVRMATGTLKNGEASTPQMTL